MSIKCLKILILGSITVGKTSIFIRYFNNAFFQNNLASIGIDVKSKDFSFENRKVKVDYIDIAGQERYRSISTNYLKGADGILLVFDLTKRESFNLIDEWVKQTEENGKDNIVKILFGNKNDLIDERDISEEEGKQLAKNLGCDYYEGSAKTGENVNLVMDKIAEITYLICKDEKKDDSLSLSTEKPKKKNKKGCC